MNDEEKRELKGHLLPLYEFAVHLIVGSLIFIAIVGFAFGLGEFIVWVDIKDPVMKGVLFAIKYIIFGTDCLLYVIFLLSSAISAGKKLWKC